MRFGEVSTVISSPLFLRLRKPSPLTILPAVNYIAVYQPSGGAAAAEDIARPQEAAASSDASSSVPVASTSPIPSIAHDAAGATGQPLLPGVTPPAKVPPASLTQVPAVLNTTSS